MVMASSFSIFFHLTNISAKPGVFDVEQESLTVPEKFLAQSSQCEVLWQGWLAGRAQN